MDLLTADGVDITTLVGKTVYVKSPGTTRWARFVCRGFTFCEGGELMALVGDESWSSHVKAKDIKVNAHAEALQWWQRQAAELVESAAVDGVIVTFEVKPSEVSG